MREIARSLGQVCLIGLLCTAGVQAGILFTVDFDVLSAADPTQEGRLFRDGIISDWSGPKDFPGTSGLANSYHYRTYIIPIVNTPYVQITVDDPPGAVFASAYLNSYNPPDLETNYLGDGGDSGNFFGVEPYFFQVVVPAGNSLVLVINDVSASGLGLNQPYSLVIEGFVDTDFNDAPEPGAFFLTGGALALAGLSAWRRRLNLVS